MSITGITPITNTNTFGQWKDRTNEIIEALEDVVTLGDAANNTGNVVITGNITASNTVIVNTISSLNASPVEFEGNISVDNISGGVAKISLKDSGVTTWEIESDITHDSLSISKGVVSLTVNETTQKLTGNNIVIDNAILPDIDVSDLTDNANAIPSDVTDLADSTNSLLPSGVIVMWSGSTSNIPQGWNLCDGTNGTPNLLDRFIVGAGGDYNVGETGGQDSVTLTEAELPAHNHSVSGSTSNDTHSHTFSASFSGTTNTAGAHAHTYVDFYPGIDFGLAGGNPGGTVSRTGTTSVAGNHSHTFSGSVSGSTSSDTHNHTFSGSTSTVGGGQSHENRPPYYALAYIMKI